MHPFLDRCHRGSSISRAIIGSPSGRATSDTDSPAPLLPDSGVQLVQGQLLPLVFIFDSWQRLEHTDGVKLDLQYLSDHAREGKPTVKQEVAGRNHVCLGLFQQIQQNVGAFTDGLLPSLVAIRPFIYGIVHAAEAV